MKKVIGIFALVIMIAAVGYFVWQLSDTSESSSEYFTETIEDYPWVRYAFRQQSERELLYYEQITYLNSTDERIGLNLLNAAWIADYITEEEGRALALLVSIAEKDSEVALKTSQAVWFLGSISSCELTMLEHVLAITERSLPLARNIVSANWFFLTRACKSEEVVRTMRDMPLDLALAISESFWFVSDITLSEYRAVQALATFYQTDKDLAVGLAGVYQPRDFEALQHVITLYSEDRELADTFFQYNSLSRESFLALADLSQIAGYNRELAQSLIDELTQDRIHVLSSLAAIYTSDIAVGEFASEKFGSNRIALRYIQRMLDAGGASPELLERTALFVTTNPEFVYEDRTEPYRYHLLTQIISEFPLDTVLSYKNLIFVTCSVYGHRFYSWQEFEYGTLGGWSSDGQLSDLEKGAVMDLLHFLIEKNEERVLVTDLRMESREYLYGVLDIPFSHPVNLDGTTEECGIDIFFTPLTEEEMAEEISLDQMGTSFVKAIIYNITTLEERFRMVQEQLSQIDQIEYAYTNPVVELILEEGEEQDRVFLYFSAKNWELGTCVIHTLHTRMDSIVMGISTTTMYWRAPESAHMYPAYIPSSSVAEKIQADPESYGNPFMYRGFIAPYDKAGFKDYLDRDIEVVKIYDLQAERNVGIYNKMQERLIYDEKVAAVILVGVVILLLVLADTFRVVK